MNELQALPSEAMRRAALEGLRELEEGFGGPGLVTATIKAARTLANGLAVRESWWRKCLAWHARHGAQTAQRAARRRRREERRRT